MGSIREKVPFKWSPNEYLDVRKIGSSKGHVLITRMNIYMNKNMGILRDHPWTIHGRS